MDEVAVLAPCRPARHQVRAERVNHAQRTRVLHTITSTTMGGAQMMLYRLLAGGDRDRCAASVLSLLGPGPIGERIAALDIPLRTLGMRQKRPLSVPAVSLIRAARSIEADVIQGWMYHGNLTASICALLSGRRTPVIWNVRHSIHDIGHENRLTRGIIRAGAALSSSPRAIIYNARVSAEQHERLGYDPAKTLVIPNGFDCELFQPRLDMPAWLRREAQIGARSIVVGMIARNHPQKDAPNLLKAIAGLAKRGIDLHVVLVGPGFEPANTSLVNAIGEAGIADRVSLLGQRHDIPQIVAGLDVATLPSAWGEGFPNVLGEAMACGVPCVTTDIGDSAWIVGHTGVVVPPRDSEALAGGLERLAALGADARRQLGATARARVLKNFEIGSIVRRYEDLYEETTSSQVEGITRNASASEQA
jgi:glycosyltransferase involved in cell wall biosynthesis